MKELTRDEVKKIADLSLLKLGETEANAMAGDLNGILLAFKALDDYPIPKELGHDKRSGLVFDDVELLGEALSRMRPDEISETVSSEAAESARSELLSVFPHREQDFLLVPQVLNKSTTGES
jgi:Asp-tRNA(Asn)/Glu-tRNA(Gln) amidotransferase C subunit